MLPAAIRQDGRYRVTKYVALRSSLPIPPNQSGPLVGSVESGMQIVALEAPRLWAGSGQHWLKVRTDQSITVYFQYATGDAMAVRQSLIRAGYSVPAAEQVASAARLNEVSFCHLQDADTARRVASLLGGTVSLSVRWIGRNGVCERVSALGTIEVWISQPG